MRHLLATLLIFSALPAHAQQHEIYSPDIASLTVMAGDDWQSMPVTSLVGGKPINIDFDELSHDFHRFTYVVTHCEADWSASENLFSSDYMQGFFTDNTIEDYDLSQDTYQLYTHYHLSIPNKNCRLTMSGNYRLTVYDDDDEDVPVLSACFMIAENAVKLSLGYTTNTDIDINARHQQLTMQADYTGLKVSTPDTQLYTVVAQNGRYDNAVINAKPQYRNGTTLRWEHCRDLIFPAGDEYFKFETLAPSHPTMGIESVGWDAAADAWHAYVMADEPRRNYVYDVDADGSFLIRNSDYDESDTKCDYIQTHFILHAPRQNGSVYLSGQWTYGLLTPDYEMTWSGTDGAYEGCVRLKQGYYSYRYAVLRPDGSLADLSNQGNYFQTENKYTALMYYRGNGDRSWRLVGYTTLTTGI
ncbi:MAG: DUF5103 domain-containing protein [Prevotella sp.]|nr:DUF5103 domain-containing protein [Prevotella sp.]